MDDEIEDSVGDVKHTDSQKSVATSNVYSVDFTDCSSEKYNSSGKYTYVIDLDTSKDSDTNFSIQKIKSAVTFKDKEEKKSLIPVKSNRDMKIQCEKTKAISRAASTKCSIFAQEIFTQTSKTIIELAGVDLACKTNTKTLETQTSLISLTENKTMDYRINVNYLNKNDSRHYICSEMGGNFAKTLNQAFHHGLEIGSSECHVYEILNEGDSDNASYYSSEKLINILNFDPKEIDLSEEQNENQYDNTSNFETTNTDTEEDSLMENPRRTVNSQSLSDVSEVTKSVDNDIQELYTKLSESIDIHSLENPCETEKRRLSPLTTLTEESVFIESSANVTINIKKATNPIDDKDVLFTNNEGMKIKLLPKETITKQQFYELPPIQNQSCTNTPHLSLLFSVNPSTTRPVTKSGTLPSVIKDNKEKIVDRWEISTDELAAGESIQINLYPDTNYSFHLPPIRAEGYITSQRVNTGTNKCGRINRNITETNPNTINIKNKIKELKMAGKSRNSLEKALMNVKTTYRSDKQSNHREELARSTIVYIFSLCRPSADSRSGSPSSTSHNESRIYDLAERSCESLCMELLRQLHSSAWYEISDTLENVPKLLERFWGVITEQRIADLIRQIIVHVESPRTQIVKSACHTLAFVLKNTNYTKKPDFYEAVTILLTKTGSYSQPVRRAANVALDAVVCGVELTHAVTALCVHGVGHKSALVRCASARLLVVCCALAAGGRELLRARPPTAACARRHALRSLATLLEDKKTETRKYAERLYSMLRPLTNFEAYYLTDVDVELASRQMKKYDQLLLCGAAKIS